VESSEEESVMEVWEEEEPESTASSDISDWTADAGIDFRAPRRKRLKKRRRKYV